MSWREICGYLVDGYLECLKAPRHSGPHDPSAYLVTGIKHEGGKVYLQSGGRP